MLIVLNKYTEISVKMIKLTDSQKGESASLSPSQIYFFLFRLLRNNVCYYQFYYIYAHKGCQKISSCKTFGEREENLFLNHI